MGPDDPIFSGRFPGGGGMGGELPAMSSCFSGLLRKQGGSLVQEDCGLKRQLLCVFFQLFNVVHRHRKCDMCLTATRVSRHFICFLRSPLLGEGEGGLSHGYQCSGSLSQLFRR